MEEDGGRQRLLDGGQPFPSSLPKSPPNEYDNALYHEQGKSPREVDLHVLPCERWMITNCND